MIHLANNLNTAMRCHISRLGESTFFGADLDSMKI